MTTNIWYYISLHIPMFTRNFEQAQVGESCVSYIPGHSCLLMIGGRYISEICCETCSGSNVITDSICPTSYAISNGTVLSLGFSQAPLPSSLTSSFDYNPLLHVKFNYCQFFFILKKLRYVQLTFLKST